jgi:pyruvyltransferase
MRRPLYYFNPYGGNFGDALGLAIIQRMTGEDVLAVDLNKRKRTGPGIVALGSIFHYVHDGDIVWGTGINPFWQKKMVWGTGINSFWQKKKRHRHLDIRAIRGPLSREYIETHLGHSCPSVYGDPALLTAILFPEKTPSPVRRVGVVPHYWDRDATRSFADVIFPTAHWDEVLTFILGCELVVASSLHALIVAEAFGIPARWWHSAGLGSARTEGVFKYNDYYASTYRSLNDWAFSIDEAIEMGGKEPIRGYDYAALIGSFPRSEFCDS